MKAGGHYIFSTNHSPLTTIHYFLPLAVDN
jgi:hypothetical protein